MKPQAVFFDLDDTLYDRGLPFRNALEARGYCFAPDVARSLYSCCKRRGDEVFHAAQRGEITMEAMTVYRYQKGFADCGIAISPEEALAFQEEYAAMQGRISLSDTTKAMLNFCRERFGRLGIITNGGGSHQRGKIAALGLEEWVDPELILISGEVGIMKPDPKIFQIAQARAQLPPEALLFVGDSPENDIAPAKAALWQVRLIDMGNPASYAGLLPDYDKDQVICYE